MDIKAKIRENLVNENTSDNIRNNFKTYSKVVTSISAKWQEIEKFLNKNNSIYSFKDNHPGDINLHLTIDGITQKLQYLDKDLSEVLKKLNKFYERSN